MSVWSVVIPLYFPNTLPSYVQKFQTLVVTRHWQEVSPSAWNVVIPLLLLLPHKLSSHAKNLLTLVVMRPMTMGAIKPGTVANVLEMPKMTPAYLGAMSTGLTIHPLPYWKPDMATPRVSRMTAVVDCSHVMYPTAMIKVPGASMPAEVGDKKCGNVTVVRVGEGGVFVSMGEVCWWRCGVCVLCVSVCVCV